MAKSLCLVLAFLCICVFSAPDSPPLKKEVVKLEPFSAINDCLPFSLKVSPSADEDVYALEIEAEEAVVGAIDAAVHDGVLNLGLKNGFKTQRVLKVTVKLPKNALEKITKSSVAALVVAPGVQAEKLTVKAGGSAAVRIFEAEINNLSVVADGTSVVFTEGDITKAKFDVSGTSMAYCYGLTKKAKVFVGDIGKIYIQAANEQVKVTGSMEALGTVFLTQGKCSVEGSGCKRIRDNSLPEFDASFSCGLKVDGKLACKGKGGRGSSAKAGGSSGSAFSSTSGGGSAFASSGGTSSSVSSSSFSSGTGGGFSSFSSSSSSSGGGKHKTVVSSGGDGADAVAVAATKCIDKDIEMFKDA